MKVEYAEDCNYWKTSSTSADTWIDKTVALIEEAGGEVSSRFSGTDSGGRTFIAQVDFSKFRRL